MWMLEVWQTTSSCNSMSYLIIPRFVSLPCRSTESTIQKYRAFFLTNFRSTRHTLAPVATRSSWHRVTSPSFTTIWLPARSSTSHRSEVRRTVRFLVLFCAIQLLYLKKFLIIESLTCIKRDLMAWWNDNTRLTTRALVMGQNQCCDVASIAATISRHVVG